MMMRTSEIYMANSAEPAGIDTFNNNVVWAIHKTYHKVSTASSGAAQLEHDTIFDIPFIAHWKIGE